MSQVLSLPAAVAGAEPKVARVLVVDDSVVARAALGRMVDATKRFAVAGSVGAVQSALNFLRQHQVDIILLDLEMPGIDGLSALPDLIAAGRGAQVLVVSAAAGNGASATIQALALGAADTLVKPGIGDLASRFAGQLEERLTRMLDTMERAEAPARSQVPTADAPAQLPDIAPFDIVAIGASTGGIHALSKLLRALPVECMLPILVTQHLPATFMPYFAAQLAVLAGRPCDVAEDYMGVRPGRLIVAPGDAHIRVARSSEGAVIRLTDEAVASGCKPSVDPMFESLATSFGKRALGIVLSGMGRDGSVGARLLLDCGASVVVQDRASSVVWGMPGAVAGATATLPPERIGQLIGRSRRR